MDILKVTKTRCTICSREVLGEVVTDGVEVFMRRVCPEHGEQNIKISSDARFYHLAKANPDNSCSTSNCCSADGTSIGTLGRNASLAGNPFETLSSCVALIEIVDSCNMPCPTCYAGSKLDPIESLKYTKFSDLQKRIQGVIDRKGSIELLQFSGGEPTLHPQLFELLDWALAHEQIEAVIINTNGLKLAHRGEFVNQMKLRASHKKLAIYLQFDGLQLEGQEALRGSDFRRHKQQTLEICGEIGLVVHLAMTVTESNLPFVSDAIKFGLKHSHIRGISLQPVFGSGRGSISSNDLPITVADIVHSVVDHPCGLGFEDFTPLPCGDPNCHTVAGLVRLGNRVRSVREFVDFSDVPVFLRDKVNFREEDLAKCGCDGNGFAEALKRQLIKSAAGFFILIKPFMDARTWDQDRIDRCCTHVIRPDGLLDSFCRYYSGFSQDKVVHPLSLRLV